MEALQSFHYTIQVEGKTISWCQSVAIGGNPIEKIEHRASGGQAVFSAGRETPDEVTLTNIYPLTADKDYFTVWRNLVPTALAQIYKRKMVITFNAPDGTPLKGWEFEGVFPLNVAPSDANLEASEEVRETVTLSADKRNDLIFTT